MKGQTIKKPTKQLSFPVSQDMLRAIKMIALNENKTLKDFVLEMAHETIEKYKKGKPVFKI